MQKFSKMIQEFLKGFNRTILSSQTLYDFCSKKWVFLTQLNLNGITKKKQKFLQLNTIIAFWEVN